MKSKLRILVLTPSLPYPPIWGFGIRVLQILRFLAERHDVTLLTYEQQDETEKLRAVSDVCRVVTVPGDSGNKRAAQLASLFSRQSFQRRSLTRASMQAALQRLLAESCFDIVQVESSQLCGFDFGTAATVLLDEHNVEYELLQRMFAGERAFLRRSYNRIEYAKFRREEERCWQRCAGVIVTSEREEAIVRATTPGKPTVTAPNGVDLDYFRADAPLATSPDIVFTGLMHYRPNVDAAMFFAREVLPHVRLRLPAARFVIVGASPPEELRSLAGPDIVVTGTVPDVRPFVQRAAAFVVPLRMGSGTRLKVLEGLAMAKPMVSTSLGCEGINVRDSEHLLIRDDPASMADAVVRLMREPAEATRLGVAGRQLVEREYGWASVGERLDAFYQHVLSERARI